MAKSILGDERSGYPQVFSNSVFHWNNRCVAPDRPVVHAVATKRYSHGHSQSEFGTASDDDTKRGYLTKLSHIPCQAWGKFPKARDDGYRVARLMDLATEMMESTTRVRICLNQIHLGVVRQVDDEHVVLAVFLDGEKDEVVYSLNDFVPGAGLQVGDHITIRITGELIPRNVAAANAAILMELDDVSQEDRGYEAVPEQDKISF